MKDGKLKILHFITNSCDHPYLYAVTDYADKDKFEVSVGTLNAAGDLQKYYAARQIETFSLDTELRRHFPAAIIKLARQLRKNRIDIIQTHLFDASFVGLAAAKLARVPLKIFTGHHSHEMQFYKSRPTYWGDCLTSRVFADHIIAPTAQMKEMFIKYENVAAEKISVIHHGFDFSNWKLSKTGRAVIRKEFGLENKTVFGAVGKIFWIKDYPMLLKAFAEAARRFSNLALMIIGTGDQTELRSLAQELKIEKQIIFTGWRTDMADLFAAMDVFVHPALAESFGMVITEAMAMAKPVVSTAVGIAPEVIKNNINGFLTPVGDQKKFAAAMEEMIRTHSDWDQMGRTNHICAKQFTAAKMVAEYEACYIKLLAKRRR